MRRFLPCVALALLRACDSANGPEPDYPPASWSVPASLVMALGAVDTIEVRVLDSRGEPEDGFYLELRNICPDTGCAISVQPVGPPPGRPFDASRAYAEVRAIAVGEGEIAYTWPGYECIDPPMCYIKDWYNVIPWGRTQVTVVPPAS